MTPSNARHGAMTRDQVLVAHAAEMIARTSLSQDRFAQALAAQLHALVPMKANSAAVPDFAALAARGDAADYLRAGSKWLKRVQRWLAGEVELPCWVEEAWLLALDHEYQCRCLNELAARHGLVGARALTPASECEVTSFGQLVACLGSAVEVCAKVLADGRISEEDAAHLPGMIDELLAVESRACELRRRAENQMVAITGNTALRVVN